MTENLPDLDRPKDGVSWASHIPKTSLPQRNTADSAAIEAAIRDRIKSFTCLLNLAQVAEEDCSDLPPLLMKMVRILPPAWQHPEACRARLVLDDQEYLSPAFRPSNWKQTANLIVSGDKRGVVEVYYVERMADRDEGPFLREERALLNLVAERIGRLVERHQAHRRLLSTIKELQLERTALQQSNAALHGALERAAAEKQTTQESIVTNVEKVLMPLLRTLDQEVSDEQKKYVSLLKDNLAEITSPFATKLSRAFMSLTAVEIRICQMIRDGLTTKEIAKMRNVSPATVARQRERIRHKLALIGTDANLATYLRTFLVERP